MSSKGRWAKDVRINFHDNHGEVDAAPVPINALVYMRGIKWSQLGTPAEAIAKGELARMLQVYQKFGAVQQPIKYKDGRMVWSVNFPPNSRWANGPEAPSAWLAMLDNYCRNDKFPGYGPLGKATDDGLRSLDKIMDATQRNDRSKTIQPMGARA